MSHRPLETGRKDISSHAALLYSNLLKQLPCSLSRAWEWHGDISPVWPRSQASSTCRMPCRQCGVTGGWRDEGVEGWRLQPPVIQLPVVFQALLMLIESSPRVTGPFLSICSLLPFATRKGLWLLSLSCWCLITTVSLSSWLSESRFLALGAFLGGHVFPDASSFN